MGPESTTAQITVTIVAPAPRSRQGHPCVEPAMSRPPGSKVTATGRAFFSMVNPRPEVHPDLAHRHAAVVATGRSDYPHQINNVLAFPGVFRGALDVGARSINEAMKLAAADALCALVGDDLDAAYVIPSPFDPRVAPAVADAVAGTARRDGLARL